MATKRKPLYNHEYGVFGRDNTPARMNRLYEDRAWLYDAAFSWDIEDEVTWLLERFGGSSKRILEPGCGSGRLMAALSRRGVEVTGVDRSQTMLDRARRRMEALGLSAPRLERGDMAAFELGTRFDGAVLPINTFGYIRTYDEARKPAGPLPPLNPGPGNEPGSVRIERP